MKRLRASSFLSLEALKMYCVMRASVPSLYNVYRRYDKGSVGKHKALSDICGGKQYTLLACTLTF